MREVRTKIKVNSIFAPLYKNELTDWRVLCFHGGRAGGKTRAVVGYIVKEALSIAGYRALCCREFHSKNLQSITQEFRDVLQDMGITQFNHEWLKLAPKITAEKIEFPNGSTILFAGCNADTVLSLKSYSNINLCVIEEAEYVTAEIENVLSKTIRGDNPNRMSQIFYIFNPSNASGYLWQEIQKCDKNGERILDGEKVFKHIPIQYFNNAFLGKSSKIELIKDRYEMSEVLFAHVWLGQPIADADSVIPVAKFQRYEFIHPSHEDFQRYDSVVIACDTAFSTRESSDNSVVLTLGVRGEFFDIIDIKAGRWTFLELENNVKNAAQNAYLYGDLNAIVIEKKASGQSLLQVLSRDRSLPIRESGAIKDKMTRVASVSHMFSQIRLPFSDMPTQRKWVKDFIDECRSFSSDNSHAHDDRVDALFYALDYVKDTHGRIFNSSLFTDKSELYKFVNLEAKFLAGSFLNFYEFEIKILENERGERVLHFEKCTPVSIQGRDFSDTIIPSFLGLNSGRAYEATYKLESDFIAAFYQGKISVNEKACFFRENLLNLTSFENVAPATLAIANVIKFYKGI